MIRTYALILDGETVHCLIEHNEEAERPLEELYAPDFIARLVDVTGLTEKPQSRDIYHGGTSFSRPPAVVDNSRLIAALKAQAFDLMMAAIDGDNDARAQLREIRQQIGDLESAA